MRTARGVRMRTARGVRRGPRVTRLAVILTGLALSLVAAAPAAAARSEFFGISQSLGRLDNPDLHRMVARALIRTERFQLRWASVEPTQRSEERRVGKECRSRWS